MNDDFYNVYKAGRYMIEMLRTKDLSNHFRELVNYVEDGTLSLDKANNEYYTRWKKETQGE